MLGPLEAGMQVYREHRFEMKADYRRRGTVVAEPDDRIARGVALLTATDQAYLPRDGNPLEAEMLGNRREECALGCSATFFSTLRLHLQNPVHQ